MKNNVVFVNFLTGRVSDTQSAEILTNGEFAKLESRIEFLSMCIEHCKAIKKSSYHLSAEMNLAIKRNKASSYEALRVQNERTQLELEGTRAKKSAFKLVA